MRAGFAIKRSASTVENVATNPAKVGGPSLIGRVMEVLAICSRACAAAHYYEEHKAMSDAALAERGSSAPTCRAPPSTSSPKHLDASIAVVALRAHARPRCARMAASTARNICGVSLPVLVL
jgi:hypothetical protein